MAKGGINFAAVFAELVSMFLFVYTCCGAAMSTPGTDSKGFKIALTFGLAIATLAYTVGHHSGAQINCAVTFALVLAGELGFCQGLANFGAQLLGAILGSLMTAATIRKSSDLTGNLASNVVSAGYGVGNAFIGEVIMTFVLCYVVLETAVSSASATNRILAPLSIGFAVFLGHSLLIPIDGCSINPTRSFGPAVVASMLDHGDTTAIWEDQWIFWLGPLVGAALAVGVFKLLECLKPKKGYGDDKNDGPSGGCCDMCCGDDDGYDSSYGGSQDEPYGKQDPTTEMGYVQTTVVEQKPYGGGPAYGANPTAGQI